VGHVACIGDEKCTQNFSHKLERKMPLGSLNVDGKIILNKS